MASPDVALLQSKCCKTKWSKLPHSADVRLLASSSKKDGLLIRVGIARDIVGISSENSVSKCLFSSVTDTFTGSLLACSCEYFHPNLFVTSSIRDISPSSPISHRKSPDFKELSCEISTPMA